ncbi:hypothetical protein LCM17_21075 [Cereibacter sphaeroides]|nr:hypothetical protein [Cereibacter sphaeroides]
MISFLPNALAQLSSLVAIVGLALVLRAYWPLTRQPLDGFGRLTINAVIVLTLAKALRSLWWDWARVFLGDHWPAVRDALGGLDVNTFFNLMVAYAAYLFLKARLHAIPEEDRHRWRWWNAWMHPEGSCVGRTWRRNQ